MIFKLGFWWAGGRAVSPYKGSFENLCQKDTELLMEMS